MDILRSRYRERLEASHPQKIIEIFWAHLNNFKKRLDQLMVIIFPEKILNIQGQQIHLDALSQRLLQVLDSKLINYKNSLNKIDSLLQALNPDRILERGYCYLEYEKSILGNGKKFDLLPKGCKVEVSFNDGKRTVVKF